MFPFLLPFPKLPRRVPVPFRFPMVYLFPWPCPMTKGKAKGKGKPWETGKAQVTSKGVWGKATGKGTYQVESEWPALGEWHGEPNPGVETGFGGGEISEVQRWQVKVAKARAPGNMRPTKRAPVNPGTV